MFGFVVRLFRKLRKDSFRLREEFRNHWNQRTAEIIVFVSVFFWTEYVDQPTGFIIRVTQ